MNDSANSAEASQNSAAALLLMSTAMLMVPVMDIIAKYLAQSLPPLEITFGRFAFQLLVCVAIALVSGNPRRLRSRRPFVNLLRGFLLSSAALSFFTAVKFMSVATAISIFFVEPMILSLLAAVILKEKIGIRRCGAILTGLAGALLILRPSFAEIGWVSLLPLCTAALFALYLLFNRLYAGADELLAVQFSTGVAGSVVLGVALLAGTAFGHSDFAFVTPSTSEIGLLAIIGIISFVGHSLVIMAFQRGEAALLAPLQYLEIVSATLFGYFVFNDLPDGPTWIGIALIVASGLYIAQRERLKAR